MKIKPPLLSLASWPYGVSVKNCGEEILLSPKPRPRQSWQEKFRTASAADEAAELGELRNKFDQAQWKW
jgi:hypothetical protein